VLAKQYEAVNAVQCLLEGEPEGREINQENMLQLWLQARRLEPWLLSVKQRLVVSGRESAVVVDIMQRTLELLTSCAQCTNALEDLEDHADGLDALWERHGDTPTADPTLGRTSTGSQLCAVQNRVTAMKRLRLLLQDLSSTPGRNMPVQHLKTFFEAQWLFTADPWALLMHGVQVATTATWRRAAGLGLLAWVVDRCSDGAEAWTSGVVLGIVADARRREAMMPQLGAEASSVAALAGC
jgi:hypothetical protein